MDKNGSIIIIEDDPDAQIVLEEVFGEIGYPNQKIYFIDGKSVLDYLYTSKHLPFPPVQNMSVKIV